MKYKVGDKVRIKGIDWYNENKDEFDIVSCKGGAFVNSMTLYCDSILTIIDKTDNCYWVKENAFSWTDEMIECKVEEEIKPKFKVGDILFYRGETCGYLKVEEIRVENGEIRYYETSRNIYLIENDPDVFADKVCSVETEETKPNTIKEAKTFWDSIKDAWICPDGYIFKDENGNVINATKIVLEKKKKEYPKTYEECLKILGFTTVYTPKVEPMFDYDDDIIALQKLKNCRNAYWKIAGEEMGLGKPWKPDWIDGEWKWCVCYSNNNIEFDSYKSINHIFSFPTKEMRDAFYENFKEDIEFCKELL